MSRIVGRMGIEDSAKEFVHSAKMSRKMVSPETGTLMTDVTMNPIEPETTTDEVLAISRSRRELLYLMNRLLKGCT